jgi:hypothetical protein
MKILSPAPLFSWFSYTTKKWQDFATVILYLRSPRHSYQRQFEFWGYSGFQMSTHYFENKKSVPLRVLSFHFAVGKMKTAIRERVCYANPLS